jgi:hypothetical protein
MNVKKVRGWKFVTSTAGGLTAGFIAGGAGAI